MSIGIGGRAKVVMQDEETVIYEYYAYSLNERQYENPNRVFDGIITIDKKSLAEPEIHEKLKKMPSGRKKLITKQIPRNVNFSSRISSGQIVVESSKFCPKILDSGIGLIAMHIIREIYRLYQLEGAIPQYISYHV
jgi:hypothetical protein